MPPFPIQERTYAMHMTLNFGTRLNLMKWRQDVICSETETLSSMTDRKWTPNEHEVFIPEDIRYLVQLWSVVIAMVIHGNIFCDLLQFGGLYQEPQGQKENFQATRQ